MNEETTNASHVTARVVGYDDGVYNLRLFNPDKEKHENVEVSKEEAERICSLLGEDVPDPEPTPPQQWE